MWWCSTPIRRVMQKGDLWTHKRPGRGSVTPCKNSMSTVTMPMLASGPLHCWTAWRAGGRGTAKRRAHPYGGRRAAEERRALLAEARPLIAKRGGDGEKVD